MGFYVPLVPIEKITWLNHQYNGNQPWFWKWHSNCVVGSPFNITHVGDQKTGMSPTSVI